MRKNITKTEEWKQSYNRLACLDALHKKAENVAFNMYMEGADYTVYDCVGFVEGASLVLCALNHFEYNLEYPTFLEMFRIFKRFTRECVIEIAKKYDNDDLVTIDEVLDSIFSWEVA